MIQTFTSIDDDDDDDDDDDNYDYDYNTITTITISSHYSLMDVSTTHPQPIPTIYI